MQQFLAVASAAARAAGALIRSKLGQYETLDTKSSAADLVTDVDRACEAILSQHLLTAFPGHAFLGEEGVTQGAARHDRSADPAQVEYLWVCDPIDGTVNFVHGVPGSTVAICLAHWGEPVLGVVYEPARDELFTAVRGQGAYVNGRPLRVRPDPTLQESLLATGFHSKADVRQQNLREFMTIAPYCRNVRCLGSAQLHLAYVAAGRLTGFWEAGLAPWDLAAGYVLVQEAGGRVTDLQGARYTLATADVLATNGQVHDAIQRLLATRSDASSRLPSGS